METSETLYTPLRAAQKLKVPVDDIKTFLRKTGRSLRSRVKIEEARSWLAERAEERRKQREHWNAIEDCTERAMFLDALGLREEHLPSVHRCEHCSEPRLDSTVAEQLGVVDAHVCRTASPDAITDVPIDDVCHDDTSV